jgi:AcrR family transcriptional regulator
MAGAYGEAAVPRGRHGLAPEVVSAQQRERLFAATVELVGRQGYRDTSIDQIVKAAQVGYGAFYGLFEGKEECFLSAFDRIVAETAEALAAAAVSADDWRGQVSAALACLVDLLAERTPWARLALIEVHRAGPRARGRYEEALGRVVPKLREGRSLDPAAEQLSPLIEEAVVGGIDWALRGRFLEPDPMPADQLRDRVVAIALSPYAGV